MHRGGRRDPHPEPDRDEPRVAIGAITFAGSLIAFAKLNGNMSGASILLPARHLLNIAIALGIVALIVILVLYQPVWAFWAIAVLSFVFGITLIIPIGGADMPVVVSMLNSYSGWAAAAMGFTLENTALIITGALVGSSGAILSYIMCKGMNRSFISVILGGFGGETAGAKGPAETRPVKQGSAEDAAFIMKNAGSVIIVPGYGMAVAQAQHAVREMADILKKEGVKVSYAIHPVAGRMPGHMNVLLAEANVPYDEVFELEDINSQFANTDVALCHRRQRCDQPLGQDRPEIADLRHADPRRGEGQDRAVHQARHGFGLCRRGERAVLPRQHDDAVRRRQEDDRRDRQGARLMSAAGRFAWRVLGVPVTDGDRAVLLGSMTQGRSREDALDFMRVGASHNTEKSGALLSAQAIFVVVDIFALDHGWPNRTIIASMLALLAGAMIVMANLKGATGMYAGDPVRGVFQMVLRRGLRFNLALYLTYISILLLAFAAIGILR